MPKPSELQSGCIGKEEIETLKKRKLKLTEILRMVPNLI